uniref:SH2 domain-containing protein n=1 Tax=Neogobius melanostomus TaxID=47308 RepID=A0A8C6WVW8_9GOBI
YPFTQFGAEGDFISCIYYGSISSQATEQLLGRYGQDGSFLLRDSETLPGAYCLCVRKAPFVHTYRLVHSMDGWSVQGFGRQIFHKLETLIETCRTLSSTEIVPLTHPLDKTHVLQHMQILFWRARNRR